MLLFKRLAFATLGILGLHSLAVADGFQYDFDHAFSGTPPTSLSAPWTQARFQDVGPGTVQLTVSNLTLTGSENVDELYFNLAPNLNPQNLNFTYVTGSGGFDLPSFTEGTNAFKADGDGKYDILLSFNHSGTDQHQFTTGEYFTYNISGISGLTAADFGYLSAPAGGAGPFYAAAHVQRIGPNSFSGWISADMVTPITPIPEPAPAALIALAISLWLGLRLSKRAAKRITSANQLRPIPISSCSLHRVRG